VSVSITSTLPDRPRGGVLQLLCNFNRGTRVDPKLEGTQRFHVMRMMFGGQVDQFDFHFIGLTAEFMTDFLRRAGFSSARRVQSFGLFNDTSDFCPYGSPISLNMIAVK
jgi:predicted SAM-dependent methyltransferase